MVPKPVTAPAPKLIMKPCGVRFLASFKYFIESVTPLERPPSRISPVYFLNPSFPAPNLLKPRVLGSLRSTLSSANRFSNLVASACPREPNFSATFCIGFRNIFPELKTLPATPPAREVANPQPAPDQAAPQSSVPSLPNFILSANPEMAPPTAATASAPNGPATNTLATAKAVPTQLRVVFHALTCCSFL